jgi:HlyD family secretion protein
VDARIRPGMTANVKILVDQKPGALKIPAAALRFQPPGAEVNGDAARTRPSPDGVPGMVWIANGSEKPTPVPVKLGISDGNAVEVLSGDAPARTSSWRGRAAAPYGRGPAEFRWRPPLSRRTTSLARIRGGCRVRALRRRVGRIEAGEFVAVLGPPAGASQPS